MKNEEKEEGATAVAATEQEKDRQTEAYTQEAKSAEEMSAELELARQEAKETYDRMLRLAAEFDNYKKRIEKERSTALKYAEEGLLRELLPSVDNLERAVEQGRTTNDVKVLLEGIELTLQGLLSSLDKVGLKPVSDTGAPFDPNYHEALAMEESEEIPENHILREFQKGYLYKDRLIRAAKVVVSKGKG